jgi:hypothetical protein
MEILSQTRPADAAPWGFLGCSFEDEAAAPEIGDNPRSPNDFGELSAKAWPFRKHRISQQI